MEILFDPHVHFYPQFNSQKFWDSAFQNFERELNENNKIEAFAICLTERNDCNYYNELSKLNTINDLNITTCDEHLILSKKSKLPLHVFPGQQINSSEGLEILALLYASALPEKTSAIDLIQLIKKSKGIPVINWAPGKWLGKRGDILKSLLPKVGLDTALGMTSLLPNSFQFPKLALNESANSNRLIILGSDPLPLSNEERLVGTCGLKLEIPNLNTTSLKTALSQKSKVEFYGKRDTLLNVAIRILKNEIKRRT